MKNHGSFCYFFLTPHSADTIKCLSGNGLPVSVCFSVPTKIGKGAYTRLTYHHSIFLDISVLSKYFNHLEMHTELALNWFVCRILSLTAILVALELEGN